MKHATEIIFTKAERKYEVLDHILLTRKSSHYRSRNLTVTEKMCPPANDMEGSELYYDEQTIPKTQYRSNDTY